MPETVLSFTVPGEPKGKARPRVTRSGHAFTPKGTQYYENAVKLCFAEKYPDHEPVADEGFIAIIDAGFAIPKSWSKKKREAALRGEIRPTKKPDADNIAKIMLDPLNEIAYKDDSQVTRLMIQKCYTAKPCVRVRLIYGEPDEE